MRKLLFSMLMLFAISANLSAQQPFGGCWHPDDIKDWTPAKDPDAKFNRSTVPLQPRFQDNSIKAHPYQFYDAQVAACLTMNPMASLTPSQGDNNFIGYNPTYWQYMDILIWWAGSAGEGIIIPPSAPVTDAAHMNGVKVLGQVFFPPTVFGGRQEWVDQMLTKEGDTYPYAKILFDIALYYGFDGWFLNEETENGAQQKKWNEFTKYYLDIAKSQGAKHHEIQWYDASLYISDITMDLVTLEGASQFLDYGSTDRANIESQTKEYMSRGFTQAEAFKSIYFGVEVARGGLSGNGGSFQTLFSKTGHKGSIDLFNPEEPIWKTPVKTLLGTPDARGEKAYEAMKEVFKNEARYWTNVAEDPSNTSKRDDTSWPGLANGMMERTTIQYKPFSTSFSAGLGKARYVNGENKGTGDWYHRGMQNIMPTWRWWIESPQKEISVNLNWDDAYNYGTSLLVKGKLSANVDHLMRLYKTKLKIGNGDKLQLVYKTSTQGSIEAKLGVSENNNNFQTFAIKQTKVNNGWSIAEIDISSLAGKTVSIIALNFKSATEIANYEASLGQLEVFSGNYNPIGDAVTNLTNQNDLESSGGNIRLVWDSPKSSEIDHFNVYLEANGSKKLVGQTRNEGYFIPNLDRTSADEAGVKIMVTTVTKDMKEGASATKEVSYPKLGKPVVTLKTNKSLAKTGDTITVVARATDFPTKYTWDVPANAKLISQKNDTAKFVFSAEGLFNIKVTVGNNLTETTKAEDLIEISDTKDFELISVGKKIHSFGGAYPKEQPIYILDGIVKVKSNELNLKWCFGGVNEHWAVVDLGEPYKLYAFKIFDCRTNEDRDNFKFFKIFTSNDAENWTLVVDEKDRPETVKRDHIKPTIARYVKLMPYDVKPFTIRVWEFQIYGLPGNLVLENPKDAAIRYEKTQSMEVKYSLGGDPKAEVFDFNIVSENPSLASISNITVDETREVVKFDITTGSESLVSTDINIALRNGDWIKNSKFKVDIIDPDYLNVALDKPAKIIFKYSSKDSISSTPQIVDENNLTNWVSPYLGSNNPSVNVIIDCGETHLLKKIELLHTINYAELESIDIFTAGEDSVYTRQMRLKDDILTQANKILDPQISARYVKIVYKGSFYFKMTLNEVKLFGKTLGLSMGQPRDLIMDIEQMQNIGIQYSFGHDKQEANFNVEVTSSDNSITKVSNLVVTEETNMINFDLKAHGEGNQMSTITTKVTNGKATIEKSFDVTLHQVNLGNISLDEIDDMSIEHQKTQKVVVKFSLGKDEEAENFGFDILTADPNIANISNIVVNKADSTMSFDITTGLKAEKSTDIVVKFTNDKWTVEEPLKVDVSFVSKGISFWPNPIKRGDIINVETHNKRIVELFTIQGATVVRQAVNSAVTQINTTDLHPGIYILKVVGDTEDRGKIVIK